MKTALAIFAAAALAALAFAQNDKSVSFDDFQDAYNKTYDNKLDEMKRKGEFEKIDDKIDEWNENGNHSHGLKHNHRDDYLDSEKDKANGHIKDPSASGRRGLGHIRTDPSQRSSDPLPVFRGYAPASVDWRSKMNPIKDQGKCGSCYAFATIGMFEGLLKIKKGVTVNLSEQHIVDCGVQVTRGMCNQCDGGTTTCATTYVKSQAGINLNNNYPYSTMSYKYGRPQSSCGARSTSNQKIAFTGNDGFVRCRRGDANCLIGLLQNGPALCSVAVELNQDMFDNYDGRGPLKCRYGSVEQTDHAVLCVGYTADAWIVRNSWGTDWGDKGYFYVKRNYNDDCGILDDPAQATVA